VRDDPPWSVERKIALHRRKIQEEGYSLWGVGFSVSKERSTPLKGFICKKGTRLVFYEAIIQRIDQYDLPRISPDKRHRPDEFREEKWKTYLALTRIDELPKPISLDYFVKCSDGKNVRNCSEGRVFVEKPIVNKSAVKRQ
jgi:hypothetical protein